METLKYKLFFLLFCIFIGFMIYLNSGTPTEDIDPKELALSNISKIEINIVSEINIYANDKKIVLTDSLQIKSIIDQMLKSTKTEIYNPKTSTSLYSFRIYFIDNTSELVGLQKSPTDGKYFFYKTSQYKNDSLFEIFQKIEI